MCGLAGFARHPDGKGFGAVVEIMSRTVEGIEHRGRHATGFAALGGAHDFIFKIAMPISELVKSNRWHDELKKIENDTTACIAHTRYATHNNAHIDAAAHPFQFGKTVGAHNGVISNWRDIQKKYPKEDTKNWDVDSEAAIYLLDRMDDPRKAVAELDGSFALSWWKDGALCFVRNTNPLTMVYVPKLRTLFWCSEVQPLHRALVSMGIDVKTCDTYTPNAHCIYQYDVSKFTNKGTGVSRIDLPKPALSTTSKRAYKGDWRRSWSTQGAPLSLRSERCDERSDWGDNPFDDDDDKRSDETYNEWLARTGRDVGGDIVIPTGSKSGKKKDKSLAGLLNEQALRMTALENQVRAVNALVEALAVELAEKAEEIDFLYDMLNLEDSNDSNDSNDVQELPEKAPF